MNNPPPIIDSAHVRAFSEIGPGIRFTGRQHLLVDGELVGPANRLAICQNGKDDYLLLLCNESWESNGCIGASSIQELIQIAERWYEGISESWQFTDYSPEEDRRNIEVYFDNQRCSFCGKLPHQVEKLFVSEAALVCSDCVSKFYQMPQSIGLVSLVVRDYDEALDFFVDKLGFELVEDTYVPEQDKRWVVVKPKGGDGACLLLAKASTEEQMSRIGDQTGGRVFLFLYTDDFWRDYEAFQAKGVEFVREPKTDTYGTVAVFKDIYGNQWDLLQPSRDHYSRRSRL